MVWYIRNSLDLTNKASQKAMTIISSTDTLEDMVATIDHFDDKFDIPDDFLTFELLMIRGRPHLNLSFHPDSKGNPELLDSGCFYNIIDMTKISYLFTFCKIKTFFI